MRMITIWKPEKYPTAAFSPTELLWGTPQTHIQTVSASTLRGVFGVQGKLPAFEDVIEVTTAATRWGGSKIVRFAKDGQSVNFEIDFPTCYHVTACCFGGPANDQLYVTTAHPGAMGGDATLIDKFPDSGHLFVVDLSGRFTGAEWRYKFQG